MRAGFVPAIRRQFFAEIKDLKGSRRPFKNLPENTEAWWVQDLTGEKMKSGMWLKAKVVVRADFAQWTGADKLRHTMFVGLRG